MSDLTKVFSSAHPFLSDPGEWLVVGAGISGADLSRFPLDGRTNVYHEEGRIRVEGLMSVLGKENLHFTSTFTLAPSDHEKLLAYTQPSPEVGDLAGEMLWVDDRLVVAYASGDGTLQGSEVYHRMGENRYAVTGSVSRQGSFVSVWKVDMVRQAKDGAAPPA